MNETGFVNYETFKKLNLIYGYTINEFVYKGFSVRVIFYGILFRWNNDFIQPNYKIFTQLSNQFILPFSFLLFVLIGIASVVSTICSISWKFFFLQIESSPLVDTLYTTNDPILILHFILKHSNFFQYPKNLTPKNQTSFTVLFYSIFFFRCAL